MNLYKLTTRDFNHFFVVADNTNIAEEKVLAVLNDKDYGFRKDRKVRYIELIGEHLEINVFSEL